MRRFGGLVALGTFGVLGLACGPEATTFSNDSIGAAGAGGGVAGSAGQPASFDTLLRAAVVAGSCIPDAGINRDLSNMRDGIAANTLLSSEGVPVECLATTGSGCLAAQVCLGYSLELYDGTCERCDGSVAANCGNGYRVRLDCAAIGMQCDPLVGCTDDAPATECSPISFTPACLVGGMPQYCAETAVETGPACADLGLACDQGRCVGGGEACENSTYGFEGRTYFEGTGCEGDTLVACVAGRIHRRDCTTVNPDFSCQSYGGEYFCGFASECIPAHRPPGAQGTPERCEGTEVIVCNAGRRDRVDCTELGFAGCDVENEYGCAPGTLPNAG